MYLGLSGYWGYVKNIKITGSGNLLFCTGSARNMDDLKEIRALVSSLTGNIKKSTKERILELLERAESHFSTELGNCAATIKGLKQETADLRQEIAAKHSQDNNQLKDPRQREGLGSYADAVSACPIKKDYTLLLRASDERVTSEECEGLIKRSICLKEHNIGVRKLRRLRSGGLAIQLQNEQSREKLKDIISSKLNDKISTKIPTRRNPCIIFKSVPINTSPEEFINDIAGQNDLPDGFTDDVKFCFATGRNEKGGTTNFVFRMPPTMYWRICNMQLINYNWTQVRTSKFTPVTRCFVCFKFGHTSRNCRNEKEELCGYCAGSHRSTECANKNDCCATCYNSSYYESANTHTAYQIGSCPAFQNQIIWEDRKVDYSCNYINTDI